MGTGKKESLLKPGNGICAKTQCLDLSPIQPDLVPPNCRFEVDDAQDDWVYPVDYFDFIHMRTLFGSISDWPRLYKQAYTCALLLEYSIENVIQKHTHS